MLIGLALVFSQTDVRVKKFFDYLQQKNITEPLLLKKPVIAFNHFLSQTYPQENPRVLALSTTRTSFLLTTGEFWHRTKTFPLCHMSYDQVSQGEWRTFLTEHKITHLVYEDGRTPDKLRLPVDQTYIEMEQGIYQLHRIKAANGPD